MTGEQKYVIVYSIHGQADVAWQEDMTVSEVLEQAMAQWGIQTFGTLHPQSDGDWRESIHPDKTIEPGKYLFLDQQVTDA